MIFPTHEDIPPLTLGIDPDHTHYGLAGWEELDLYGYHNLALWNSVTKQCEHHGVSETDRLRLLLWHYVGALMKTQQEFADYSWRNPGPVMGPNGEVWRYMGP